MFKGTLFRSLFSLVMLMPVSDVMSKDISFDYIEATFISDTIDLNGSRDDVEGSGIGFSLSLEFAPAFAMTLAVAATTFRNFQSIDVDSSKMTSLGVTVHSSVASGTDIFGNVSAVMAETTADVGGVSVNDDDIGATISIGVRHLLTDRLEVELGVSQVKVFGYTFNSYKADARFFLRKKFSVGLGYSSGDEVDALFLNARVNF